jgi:hypothetical protein
VGSGGWCGFGALSVLNPICPPTPSTDDECKLPTMSPLHKGGEPHVKKSPSAWIGHSRRSTASSPLLPPGLFIQVIQELLKSSYDSHVGCQSGPRGGGGGGRVPGHCPQGPDEGLRCPLRLQRAHHHVHPRLPGCQAEMAWLASLCGGEMRGPLVSTCCGV